MSNDESVTSQYMLSIVSIPGLFLHLKSGGENIYSQMKTMNLLEKMIDILRNDERRKIVFNSLDENYKLCLLGKKMFIC